MGNYGPKLDYFYHRAVVVVWPRSHSLQLALKAELDSILNLLELRLGAVQVGTWMQNGIRQGHCVQWRIKVGTNEQEPTGVVYGILINTVCASTASVTHAQVPAAPWHRASSNMHMQGS